MKAPVVETGRDQDPGGGRSGDREENEMGSADSNKEILEALREVLVDRLKVEAEAVTPQANLFDDLGLDSIDLMSVRPRAARQDSGGDRHQKNRWPKRYS